MPIGHKTSKSSLATRIPHRPPVGPTLRSANRIKRVYPFLGLLMIGARRPTFPNITVGAQLSSLGTRFERVEL